MGYSPQEQAATDKDIKIRKKLTKEKSLIRKVKFNDENDHDWMHI